MTARARNLNGQLKSLAMRRVQEGTAVYFIGEVGISGDEILVFGAAGVGGHRIGCDGAGAGSVAVAGWASLPA